MSEPCDVLLAGTMGTIGATVRESLLAHGLRTETVEFPQNVFNDEPGYRRAVLSAVDALRPKIILPIGNPLALSRMKGLLPEDTVAGVEDEPVLRLLDSKVSFSRLAAELGIRQPRIFNLDEVSFPDDAAGGKLTRTPEGAVLSGVSNQLVFKRDISFGGQGVHLPRTMSSLLNLIEHQRVGEPYLIEEFIDGYDFSADAVRDLEGRIALGFYRVLCAKGQGPSENRVTVCTGDPEFGDAVSYMDSAVRLILGHTDYHGVCGFDFRVSLNGIPYILECNPRFTGGIATQISSGFDIPYLAYLSLSQNIVSPIPRTFPLTASLPSGVK